jgi:hypothetical protein
MKTRWPVLMSVVIGAIVLIACLSIAFAQGTDTKIGTASTVTVPVATATTYNLDNAGSNSIILTCPTSTCGTFNGFSLSNNKSANITAHGTLCQKITNKSGANLFIPAKYPEEWTKFLASSNGAFTKEACSGGATCPAPLCSSLTVVNPMPGMNVSGNSQTCYTTSTAPCTSQTRVTSCVCDDGYHPIGADICDGCELDVPGCGAENAGCSTGNDCCSSLCVNGSCRSECGSYGGQACSDSALPYTADGTCVNVIATAFTNPTSIPNGCANSSVARWTYYSNGGSPHYNYYDTCNYFAVELRDLPQSEWRSYECRYSSQGGYSSTQGICTRSWDSSGGYPVVSCDSDEAAGEYGDCFYVYGTGFTPADTDACDSSVADGVYAVDGICARTVASPRSEETTNCLPSVCVNGVTFYVPSACSNGAECDTNTTDGQYVRDGYVCNKPAPSTCVQDGSKSVGSACCQNENCSSGVCTANVCAPVPFVCTGSVPANATLCAGDAGGLAANTPITAVTACDVPKCEYRCNSGYDISGGACVPAVCTGAVPANATLCTGDDTGLTRNSSRVLAASCTSTKCEYICNSGYDVSGGACVPAMCTGAIPANTVSCPGDEAGLDKNVDRTVVNSSASCGAPKCEYYCNTANGYILDGAVCRLAVCTGTVPVNATACPGTGTEILTADTANRIVNNGSCLAALKCDYACKYGYGPDGGSDCVEVACAGVVPGNATECADGPHPFWDTTIKINASCSASVECDYKCNAGRIKTRVDIDATHYYFTCT